MIKGYENKRNNNNQSVGVGDSVGVLVLNEAQLQDIERKTAEANASFQNKTYVTELAAHIRKSWDEARNAKANIESRLILCRDQRDGKYSAEEQAIVEESGGSKIYMMLTEEKCAAAAGWIEDILFNQADKPYSFRQTVLPEVAPMHEERIQMATFALMREELMRGMVTPQQVAAKSDQLINDLKERLSDFASKQVEGLNDQIDDHMVHSKWREAMLEVIDDYVTYPIAVLKGPYLTFRKRIKWGAGGKPCVIEDLQYEYCRVSPFDYYTQPGVADNSEGYEIERHTLTKSTLHNMIGLAGYNDDAIRSVLQDNASGSLTDWLTTEVKYENRSSSDVANSYKTEYYTEKNEISALQFWGTVQGRKLLEWGMEDCEVTDPDAEYPVEAWLIGNHVIKAVINPDPLGRSLYNVTSYRKRNGDLWGGIALPEIIRDAQQSCNAAARAIQNNMAVSSGPQVAIDSEKMPPGEDITNIYPWKIWNFENTNGQTPVWFFQPQSQVNELMRVYEFFSNEADNKSGIPKYSYGTGSGGGALSTATGFSMMMNNTTKGVRKMVNGIDGDLIVPSVHGLYERMMLNGQLNDYHGDIEVIATGSRSILMKEQAQMRRNEFLQIVNSNPIFINLIGEAGLAEILRKISDGLDIDIEQFIPSPEELRQKQQMMMMLQAQEAMKMQAAQQAAVQGQQTPAIREANGAGQPVSGADVRIA